MEQVIFWLVLLIVLVLIEIATLGLTTIWFAGGSLIALIAAAFGAPLYLGEGGDRQSEGLRPGERKGTGLDGEKRAG